MDAVDKFIDSSNPDALVTIIPEDTSETIVVSKTLLCQTSQYFAKALRGPFKEGTGSVLRLPGWTADVIKLFLFWLYKKTLPSCDIRFPGDETYKILVRLWVFADAHLIPQLQNAAIEMIWAFTEWRVTGTDIIQLVYEIAPKDSLLCKLVMDEARCDYFNPDVQYLTEEELETLARVPGLLAEFMGPVRACFDEECTVSSKTYRSARQNGIETYQVRVEAEEE